ncbi:MAG: hypothetical protein ABJA82_00505 [Myxococcales bacterium]
MITDDDIEQVRRTLDNSACTHAVFVAIRNILALTNPGARRTPAVVEVLKLVERVLRPAST